ncbi:MAG: hypothetical protein KIH01_08925 [Candidatus Freyarchaeota archaeon]|nr:hypothetical protein [Candidatus Jordarchaeia archaeon]
MSMLKLYTIKEAKKLLVKKFVRVKETLHSYRDGKVRVSISRMRNTWCLMF